MFGLWLAMRASKYGKFVYLVIVIIAFVLFFSTVSVKFKAERSRLNDSLKKALKEKEEVKSSLIEKEKRLNELRDIQGIKSALSNSQGTIEQLSREIDRLRTEKSALQETNLSISSRLQNLTREFSQILEESRRVKDDLGNVDKKFISPLKKKMEEFEKAALIKDDEIDKQKNELAKLKQAQVILMDANKELQVRLGVSKKDTSDRGNATQAFIDNINKLKASLAEKENQVRSLESEVSRAKAGRLPSNLKEPGEANGSLQLTRLSEILARKELDLDQAKKEAKESIAKITALQNRITVLEKNLSEAQIDRDKFKEVEAEKVSSQYRLRDMKDELAKKNDLADSLQKNLNYLTQQLTKFEDENKSLQLKLARLQETDLSFNSLKMQVNQLSDFVAAKEKELSDRRKEMDTLRDEVASLRLRSAELEKELAENRARQRKTLDDLSTVLKLNAALQERNSPSGQSITGSAIDPKVKQKSDDLKRKIEVILESDKQN